MTYIFIFDDGSVRQSSTAPTKADLLCVGCGILTILRVPNLFLHEVDEDGEDCDVGVSDIAVDDLGREYHTV